MKYLRKPAVVDAFEVGRHQIPDWCKVNDFKNGVITSNWNGQTLSLYLSKQGDFQAHQGTFVIRDSDGHFSRCSGKRFVLNYELCKEESAKECT
jgi:hypothetical protein